MLPRGLRAMRALRGLGRCPLGRAFAEDAAKATATATATATQASPVNPKPSGLPMTTPGAPGAVRPKVVIVGTGWASFRVLADIDTKKNDVTVISPRNHLLFTPMLASSALGTVNQRSICQPVRPLTAKKNATYYESSVVGVDKEKQLVTCKTLGGQEYNLPYDKLVVGIGFQPNDFNIPGVKENALFMKETADATRFKDHVLEKLEEAAYCHALDNDLTLSDEEKWKIQELLTFIVVGGGPTGVELAGELTDFLYNEVANLYKNLKPYIRVHMFTYDLLNTFDEKLQDYAITHLRKKQNVQVHLGAFVQKVEPNVVHVKLGESAMSIRYGTLVWCAGIKPHPFVSDFGFAMNDKGSQILVDPFLKVKGERTSMPSEIVQPLKITGCHRPPKWPINKVSIWLKPWAWTRARPSPSSFTTRALWHTWVDSQQSWPTFLVSVVSLASWHSSLGVSPIGFYNFPCGIASCW